MSLTGPVRAAWVGLAAFLAFAGCLTNPWLWDDKILLGQRLAPDQCAGLADIWPQPYWGGTYRPLSLALIYLEHRVFGEAVLPYHAISLALHAAVSLLVLAVLGRLAGPKIGFAAALLFAVHPVHAEAVAMVYGQLELLAALFVLLSLGFYVHARRDGIRPLPFALSLLFAFLAMCSKESALMLPALLLLVRAAWMVGDGDTRVRSRQFARGIGWDLLFVIVAVPYLVLRYKAVGHLTLDPEMTVSFGYSFGERVKTVVVSIGHALRLCTLPTDQTLYYGHLRDAVFGRPYNELLWILLAGGVLVWLVARLGRGPALFGAAWFFLTLFPVSNIIPSGVLVGERTLYMPSLGICFLAAALYASVAGRAGIPRWLAPGALGGLVAAYAVAAALVVDQWRDDETLWRSTVRAHPRSPLGQLMLGEAMVNRWQVSGITPTPEELQAATDAFAAAYRLNPNLTEALAGSEIVEKIRRNLPSGKR